MPLHHLYSQVKVVEPRQTDDEARSKSESAPQKGFAKNKHEVHTSSRSRVRQDALTIGFVSAIEV